MWLPHRSASEREPGRNSSRLPAAFLASVLVASPSVFQVHRGAVVIRQSSLRKKIAAKRGSAPVVASSSEICEWARAIGFEARDRSAIPTQVRSAYIVAHT